MNAHEEMKLRAELAALREKLANLEAKEAGRQVELLPGFSWITGSELKGKAYRQGEINACIKHVCEIVRDTGLPQTLTCWHRDARSEFNSFGVLVNVKVDAPTVFNTRTISVAESEAYFRGEETMLLQKVRHDPHAYRYRRVRTSLRPDGSERKYMRIRGRS